MWFIGFDEQQLKSFQFVDYGESFGKVPAPGRAGKSRRPSKLRGSLDYMCRRRKIFSSTGLENHGGDSNRALPDFFAMDYYPYNRRIMKACGLTMTFDRRLSTISEKNI